MTLAEYRAWLDGMIAATGDERLKVAREKLAEVQEAAPIIAPLSPPPFVSPTVRPWWMDVTCTTVGRANGQTMEGVTVWNGVN